MTKKSSPRSERDRVIESLAHNVEALVKARGYETRRQFALAIGVHEDVLQKIVKGMRMPTLETLLRIADGVGVRVDVLVGDKVKAQP